MNFFLSVAIVLAGALVLASLTKRLRFPAVTAYLLLGILLGSHLLQLIPGQIYELSTIVSLTALGFIAFLLGESLSLENLRKTGKSILWISVFETVGVCIFVTVAIYFGLHQPFYVAILLGAISTATAPAATTLVAREYKAKGTFTNTLLGIVAIDDAWGIIIFTICLSIARLVHTPEVYTDPSSHEVLHRLFEIPGSLLLGGLAAVALSKTSKHLNSGTDILVLIVIGIFFVIGLSILLDISVLLANVALGTTLANIDRKPSLFFDTLREVDTPIYIMFFVLAGARFDILALMQLSGVGLAYTMCRMAGKVAAAFAGGHVAGSDRNIKRYMGLALFPQAGVALGMALVVESQFPQASETVFTIVVATTVIFEFVGPICTRYALAKAGEIKS